MSKTRYEIDVPAYEGPLDLLLQPDLNAVTRHHCASLAKVTNQF